MHLIVGGGAEKLHVESGVNLENALINVASGEVSIGKDTFFGHSVCLLTGHHPIMDGIPSKMPANSGHDITIGQNVWICSNATVIGPCKIGDRCVIAAGAVVVKDCEPNSLYAGVPAKKVKSLI